MIEDEDAIGPVTFHVAPPAIEGFVIATLSRRPQIIFGSTISDNVRFVASLTIT